MKTNIVVNIETCGCVIFIMAKTIKIQIFNRYNLLSNLCAFNGIFLNSDANKNRYFLSIFP